MPPKGLTKALWNEHMRKYIAFYLVGIVVMCVLTNLVFTTTRYVVPEEKEVLIYLTAEYANADNLDALAADALAYGQSIDPDLESVHFETMLFSDPTMDPNSGYLIMTRLAAGEGDIWICDQNAFNYLCSADVCNPVAELAEAHGLALATGLNADGEETGEGIRLDPFTSLTSNGIINARDCYMVLANNTKNQSTSRDVADYILTRLEANDYMPVEETN